MATKIPRQAKQSVVIAVVINLALGAQYCWSMLGRGMIREYGWTATQASLPYSVLMVVAATWAVVAGKIGDYFKPKYATLPIKEMPFWITGQRILITDPRTIAPTEQLRNGG